MVGDLEGDLAGLLQTAFDSTKKVEEMRAAMRAADEVRDNLHQFVSQMLFKLAATAEGNTEDHVQRELDKSKYQRVSILDIRKKIWNGKPEDPWAESDEFTSLNIKPCTVWFWTDGLVYSYSPFNLRWYVFDANKVSRVEKIDGNEKKKRKLH